jgi:hypothetical protein
MGKISTPWLRGAVSLAVLVGLGAALVASPAGAHFLHPSKAQVKKVAKKQATKVFNSLFPSASTGLQAKCANGTVLAYALIDDAPGAAFSTSGVLRSFNCAGGPIEARTSGMGLYEVRIPGITTPSIPTTDSIAATLTVAEDTDDFAAYDSTAGDDFISVEITDDAGTNTNDEFSIAVYNKP